MTFAPYYNCQSASPLRTNESATYGIGALWLRCSNDAGQSRQARPKLGSHRQGQRNLQKVTTKISPFCGSLRIWCLTVYNTEKALCTVTKMVPERIESSYVHSHRCCHCLQSPTFGICSRKHMRQSKASTVLTCDKKNASTVPQTVQRISDFSCLAKMGQGIDRKQGFRRFGCWQATNTVVVGPSHRAPWRASPRY